MENASASSAPPFEIDFYQLVDDAMLAKNRADGNGFGWSWSDVRREWMDATPSAFAYRCLPLTIANQLGWTVTNPIGFTAFWRGSPGPGGIDFRFDANPEFWRSWINDQFGCGIITWNTPFLIRTRPAGSRLLVVGPTNRFKQHCHPLTAMIETDWMTASFTMNWKLMAECESIRFEPDEPLMQLIPLANNVFTDLERAQVSYQRLTDDPATYAAYSAWHEARKDFHAKKRAGDVKPTDWQKDYFRGQDVTGRDAPVMHHTKLVPPKINYKGSTKP
jgi:Family of unknown function (DUF6065)